MLDLIASFNFTVFADANDRPRKPVKKTDIINVGSFIS
jgi:hypothetical protein